MAQAGARCPSLWSSTHAFLFEYVNDYYGRDQYRTENSALQQIAWSAIYMCSPDIMVSCGPALVPSSVPSANAVVVTASSATGSPAVLGSSSAVSLRYLYHHGVPVNN